MSNRPLIAIPLPADLGHVAALLGAAAEVWQTAHGLTLTTDQLRQEEAVWGPVLALYPPAGESSWTVRITFAWTGPRQALERLGEIGTLEHLEGDEHAWTLTLSGDLGPGTDEERAGRAAWVAQDALEAQLGEALGEDADPARFFTHRSTEHLQADRHG
ncbi:hypothetical protein DQ384_38015 [Sphaerisporangium album]|uniref:Uncharacterized protein n=1 Tax=Sphaerisporangium album TaxID=509200 RepID=A0A367EMT9_9ACTN|nr:hypothetical protein [Sphaerisporangium album]RCG19079.1 hypothetical protein DQ384_38015 [Sphaerisporangium album]